MEFYKSLWSIKFKTLSKIMIIKNKKLTICLSFIPTRFWKTLKQKVFEYVFFVLSIFFLPSSHSRTLELWKINLLLIIYWLFLFFPLLFNHFFLFFYKKKKIKSNQIVIKKILPYFSLFFLSKFSMKMDEFEIKFYNIL